MPNESEPMDSAFPIILDFEGRAPVIHPSVWIAPGAVVVGDVEIGEDSSIWYGTVLRGDVHSIRIGARSNIQDLSTIHVTQGLFPAVVGDEVTVGHRAVVHGCRVHDGALVGIGAIVLDGAEIGEGAWVAAGALVTPDTFVEPRTLVAGVPARPIRTLAADELDLQKERTLSYVSTARSHAANGRRRNA